VSIKEALGLESREHIALVGGGGKTSLMFALAEELRHENKRIITTTTTKVWHRQALKAPCFLLLDSSDYSENVLNERLGKHGHVFLGERLLDNGKIEGVSTTLGDLLFNEQRVDYLIVEADGAAGRPAKAPAEHEPVIPSSVTKVIAVLGLDALGKVMGPDVVFREKPFVEITGIQPGEILETKALSKLFSDPKGLYKGTPPGALRMAFLNKLDTLTNEKEAEDLAASILNEPLSQIDRVILGSVEKGFYYALS